MTPCKLVWGLANYNLVVLLKGKKMTITIMQYSKDAHEAMALAHEEAKAWNARCLDTHHLLLGIIRQNEEIARLLIKMQVTLGAATSAAESICPRGSPRIHIGTLRMSRDLQTLLHRSYEIWGDMTDTSLLMLAMTQEEKCVGCKVLQALGVNLETIRQQTQPVEIDEVIKELETENPADEP